MSLAFLSISVSLAWLPSVAGSGTLGGAQPSGNRAWLADVELVGPLEEVRFDLGEGGATVLSLSLIEGEERTLAVPLPVRLPDGMGDVGGAKSLRGLPAPEITARGAGSVRWVGWSSTQPGDGARTPTGLAARPRAPGDAPRPQPGSAELAILLAAFVLGVFGRRRPWLSFAAGAGGALVVFVLSCGRASGDGITRVLEVDLEARAALRIHSARADLDWPHERVEVVPAGTALVFLLELDGARLAGRVSAPRAMLHGLRREEHPALGPSRNGFMDLAEAWLRAPSGELLGAGPWGRGDRFPVSGASGALEAAPAPPGWLASGLPPGTPVLLARAPDGLWLRVTGFVERD